MNYDSNFLIFSTWIWNYTFSNPNIYCYTIYTACICLICSYPTDTDFPFYWWSVTENTRDNFFFLNKYLYISFNHFYFIIFYNIIVASPISYGLTPSVQKNTLNGHAKLCIHPTCVPTVITKRWFFVLPKILLYFFPLSHLWEFFKYLPLSWYLWLTTLTLYGNV